MRILTVIIIVLAVPVVAHAATLKVPSQYPTIQDAIDAASGGDTVLVAPGTYVENIDFLGKAITVKSTDGPNLTILDGNGGGRIVSFISGEGPKSVLDGFKITNGTIGGGISSNNSSPVIINNIICGNATKYTDGGGGIYCSGVSTPLIYKNIITENEAGVKYSAPGGGIRCLFSASPLIFMNTITRNTASDGGGGISDYNGGATIMYNLVSENACTHSGGGIICGESAIVSNNIIADNIAEWWGGGILCKKDSSPIIQNNIIYRNRSIDDGGGGICCSWGSSPLITNNTIFENVAEGGGGIQCMKAFPMVTNTILWNNSATIGPEIHVSNNNGNSILTISYSNVKSGKASVHVESNCTLNWGPGMIDSDPLFVDESNGDYHITFNSPCRGSGDNTAVTELTDFEGDPRIAYGTVDMGADEFYTHLYWTGDAVPGGNVALKFVGLPGTSPVGLCIGTGVLDPPIPSMWGDWYLQFPILGPIGMPQIPSTGVLIVPGTIPGSPPAPYSIPMQALIGAELPNLSILKVQ